MPEIQFTSKLGKSAPKVQVDLKQPSSLLKYAKTELLHLLVVPDFIERAPQPLATAAPNPISFQLELAHEFQLGGDNPEISLTPGFQAIIRANTTEDSNLFAEDLFPVAARVPAQKGYVSLGLAGSLTLGISGSSGNLSFGMDHGQTVSLEYWKAFSTADGGPPLGEATGQMLSSIVIPATLEDLDLLSVDDICTVSGQGRLTISGGFDVSASPNPLASVALPLNAGKVEVKAGVMAGLEASYEISGSYQIRVRRTAADTIELSCLKQKGATLTTNISASGGVAVRFGNTDLLKSLLGAIMTNPNDEATLKLFEDGGLKEDEIATLTDAIKEGVDRSLRASLDLALSQVTDDQAVFQYEIQTRQLDSGGRTAVSAALRGDLSGLTKLESDVQAGLAPGVKLVSSVLSTVRKRRTTLKLNLLGLVNFISVTELIRKCVVVKDPDTGYVTIADTATGNRINAETGLEGRRNALHKAMFESVMLTATYRVSATVSMPELSSHNFHFAFNSNTKKANLDDYLDWFVAMNLVTAAEREAFLNRFPGGGPSTCLLRTDFDANACRSMFFQASGELWDSAHYLDIGRRVMSALIDRDETDVDGYRYRLLDQHWEKAFQIGPNNNLAELVGLHLTDSTHRMIVQFLSGDVYDIAWWANAMCEAGKAIVAMQEFLVRNPGVRADDRAFVDRRKELQSKMAEVTAKSKARFDDPWGLIALLWAAGSAGGSGKLVAKGLVLQKADAVAESAAA